jgi:hypothetical protein
MDILFWKSGHQEKQLNLNTTSMKKKKFDAVKMMRDIRDKLTKRYLENPDLEISDLKKIRRKYKIIKKTNTHFA